MGGHGPIRMASLAALLIAVGGCADDGVAPDDAIRIETIERSGLPALDPERAYESLRQGEEPEHRVRDLLAAGIPVVRAWMPLDNLCLDPIGPRLTVELARREPAILELEFVPGTGRLACATRLTRLTVER